MSKIQEVITDKISEETGTPRKVDRLVAFSRLVGSAAAKTTERPTPGECALIAAQEMRDVRNVLMLTFTQNDKAAAQQADYIKGITELNERLGWGMVYAAREGFAQALGFELDSVEVQEVLTAIKLRRQLRGDAANTETTDRAEEYLDKAAQAYDTNRQDILVAPEGGSEPSRISQLLASMGARDASSVLAASGNTAD